MCKNLLLIIILITALYNTAQPASQELSELTANLSQLQYINSKFIVSSETKTLAKYPVPTAEFYTDLENSLKEAFNGNTDQLDAHIDKPSAQVAKYMFSISNEMPKLSNRASNILLLVQLFDRVQAKYQVNDNIIITSVSTGDAAKEKILLKTLYHFGYESIKFYAIDPAPETIKAIESFREDTDLKKYKYQQFDDTKLYAEEVMRGQKEKPNVCLTFFPNISMNARRVYDPIMHNTCNDRAKNHKLTTILILPYYFDELNIITSEQDIIKKTNTALKEVIDIKFAQVKQTLPKILHKPYRCEQNVLLNFLEIIKLASSTNNDCIAYYKSGNDIDTYYNIASKSIAQLYLETSSIYKFYTEIMKADLRQFQLWNYNAHANQFEQTK